MAGKIYLRNVMQVCFWFFSYVLMAPGTHFFGWPGTLIIIGFPDTKTYQLKPTASDNTLKGALCGDHAFPPASQSPK